MKDIDASRRAFLAQSGSLLGATWLSLSLPSLLEAAEQTWQDTERNPTFEVLSDEEVAEVDAIVSQIIPSDDTPGAHEAGVVHFIDRSLTTFNAGLVEPLRGGISAIQNKAAELFPGSTLFSALGQDDQLVVMKAVESEGYFGLIQFLTVVGMFSHPSYGGNRDRIGWKMIEFDDRHAWQPPFGYYDANQSEEN